MGAALEGDDLEVVAARRFACEAADMPAASAPTTTTRSLMRRGYGRQFHGVVDGQRAQAEPLEDRPAVRRRVDLQEAEAALGGLVRPPRHQGPVDARGRGTASRVLPPHSDAKSVPAWKLARAAQTTVPSSATASHIEVPCGSAAMRSGDGPVHVGGVLVPDRPAEVVDALPVGGRALGVRRAAGAP